MSALDAGFWQLEDAEVALHIGAVAVFAGPAPDLDAVRSRYARVILTTPRYRQRMHSTPLALQRPAWIDDARFDLAYHVRRTAVPSPGGQSELVSLVGRIMSGRLDPDRPLWEAWLVEGLADEQWALVWKVHHSVVDGMGGVELLEHLLDPVPGARPAPRQRRAEKAFATGSVGLAASSVLDGLRAGRAAVRGVRGVATRPGRTVRRLVTGLRGGVGYAAAVTHPIASTSLTGPLGRARRYRVVSVPLDEVRTVRAELGGSVNDVALTMISRGFRDLLVSRHEPAAPRAVRSLVPVSVRSEFDRPAVANKVSALLLDLPVDFAEAGAAHGAVRARMAALKSSGEAAGGELTTALAAWLPAPAVGAAVRTARRLPQRVLTTVTTNVPGPRVPVRLLGREMTALYPYVPIGDHIRIAVAITSYNGRVSFGITSDREAVPDIEVLTAGIRSCLDELIRYARELRPVRS